MLISTLLNLSVVLSLLPIVSTEDIKLDEKGTNVLYSFIFIVIEYHQAYSFKNRHSSHICFCAIFVLNFLTISQYTLQFIFVNAYSIL